MRGFKAKEVGLATFGEFAISGHAVDYGRNGIHVDRGEVCGLGFIVVWVVELAENLR